MGIILLSAYLAGIIYWTIETRKVWKESNNDPWRMIGFILGICIWPIWLIVGIVNIIKEVDKDEA